MAEVRCRHCKTVLEHVFVDLGLSPVANQYLKEEQIESGQRFLPLKVYVCEACKLVQVDEVEIHDHIFNGEYAYFSSYSKSWLMHAECYVDAMVNDYDFDIHKDQIIEIASNDGYLLQYFKKKGYKVLGIDPSANTAEVAIKEKGVDTVIDFFGTPLTERLIAEYGKAKLLIANNVLAHVPDIDDFVEAMKAMLADDGIITIEFPHMLNLIKKVEFDTIYHEHYSYISCIALQNVLDSHNLSIFRIEKLKTHGGSLRVYASHSDSDYYRSDGSLEACLADEVELHMDTMKAYNEFQARVNEVKMNTLEALIAIKREGKTVAGFGAPAKGNTFLNYTGIGRAFIDYTVDDTPIKQYKYLPGTLIPVYEVETIFERKPDYVFILPWNLKDEIVEKMKGIREWGGKFITAIPELEIF